MQEMIEMEKEKEDIHGLYALCAHYYRWKMANDIIQRIYMYKIRSFKLWNVCMYLSLWVLFLLSRSLFILFHLIATKSRKETRNSIEKNHHHKYAMCVIHENGMRGIEQEREREKKLRSLSLFLWVSKICLWPQIRHVTMHLYSYRNRTIKPGMGRHLTLVHLSFRYIVLLASLSLSPCVFEPEIIK